VEVHRLERLVQCEEQHAQRRQLSHRRDIAEALLRLAHAYTLAKRQQDVLTALQRAAAIYAGIAARSAAAAYLGVVEASVDLGLERAALRAARHAQPPHDPQPASGWRLEATIHE
jgi:hypothetical protein